MIVVIRSITDIIKYLYIINLKMLNGVFTRKKNETYYET